MYLILKKEKLKEIVLKAVQKAGTYRKLSGEIKIPVSTIYNYISINRTITKENLDRLLAYLGTDISKEEIIQELPDNWKQIIGGKNCVKKKQKEGKLDKQLKEARKHIINGKRIGDWHKKMRKQNPEAYYKIQYEHFQKVGHYKLITKNGEKVRNALEKKTADILKRLGIVYKYEPLIKAENRYFFPDFVINDKVILECTMWRGYDKAIKLKEKIRYLNKKYKVYVIIPPKLEKYYGSIKDNLILGLDNFQKIIQQDN